MKYLDSQVSIYSSVLDNVGTITTLRVFLTSQKYRDKIENLRRIEEKKERDNLKKQLPLITVSGIFSPTRTADNLIEHTRLICLDIDAKDNLHIKNFADLKSQIARIKEVLYCALSASGNGYFVIIPIKNPKYHKEHFEALQQDFLTYGIVIDKNCKDVCRMRGYSYDSNPYINEHATIYTNMIFPKKVNITLSGNETENVAKVAKAIHDNHINIADTYDDWFMVGRVLFHELGENGRSYFHAISSLSSKYNASECDRMFNRMIKTSRSPIGTFFQLAKQYGVLFKDL